MVKNLFRGSWATGALIALCFLSRIVLADVAPPTPTPKAKSVVEPAGYEWGSIIGVGLFILAGLLIVVWVISKLSKRESK